MNKLSGIKPTITQNLIKTFPTFKSLYDLFGPDLDGDVLLAPFINAFKINSKTILLEGKLESLGIYVDALEEFEGFYIQLKPKGKLICLFESCSIGGYLDFDSAYAITACFDEDLDNGSFSIEECLDFNVLLEKLVDYVFIELNIQQ